MSYSITVSAYLERIDRLLKDGTEASLLYAALELRCGVEARMKEYLSPQDHVPKSRKNEWAIAKLSRSIENAFRSGDKIMIFTVRAQGSNTECSFTYTPVSSRLQQIGEHLGDYLHLPKAESAQDPHWWSQLREVVRDGYAELLLANSGELLGLPLVHKSTGQLNLRVILADGDPRMGFIEHLAKSREQHLISVQYIEPIPGKKTFYEN